MAEHMDSLAAKSDFMQVIPAKALTRPQIAGATGREDGMTCVTAE
jgi:hypothetical protein